MSDIAIRVEGVSKLYRLGAIGAGTLRGDFERWWARMRGRPDPLALVDHDGASTGLSNSKSDIRNGEIWALRDVTFEVREGEVLGIIGRNGAGKSTLLKILSQVTAPTEGCVKIRGRVASLLEVGTGFHPELTGRENIYLNGAVLGMKRGEIDRKFDEIVDFSGVERFIETPVKRYSSGMYVRLAFAVAAHLEPEILVVDEVLAVGDAAFQKKCLGRMGAVAEAGRTVLFVSHNMDAIRRLCSRVVWLEAGAIKRAGPTDTVIGDYLLGNVCEDHEIVFDPPIGCGNAMPARFHGVRVFSESGFGTTRLSAREAIRIEVDWEITEDLYKPRVGFVIQSADGTDLFLALDATSWDSGWVSPGRRISTCVVPGQLLNEGEYVIDLGADALKARGARGPFPFTASRTRAVLRFVVDDDMTLPNKYYGQEGFRDARWPGFLLLDLKWSQRRNAATVSASDLPAQVPPGVAL